LLANLLPEQALWDIRAFVYRHFADTTRAPSVDETADAFALTHDQAASAYEALHARHALFLEPGRHEIRMANPFSNIETPFRVQAGDKTYFANCAWDSLGIPAALHSDADVEAVCAHSGEQILLQVRDGQVSDSVVLAHFLVPFERWYADLIST
jgi:DNA-binding transcriptional MocR family regulator